jgi:arylsulfatase A-like enzyme
MRAQDRLWPSLLLGILLLGCDVAAAEQRGSRPHILYIVADDLGWKDVGYHGSDIKTPTIDALAQGGARLEQFYVQPMCTPTRAALMTGRYPLRYGLQSFVILPEQTYGLPTDEWLLPQALKEAGYRTAIVGKWHLGHARREYWPRRRGFDHQYGALIGEIDYFTHSVHGVKDWYRNDKPINEKGYVTTQLGQEAVQLIGQHDPSRPLFLYLAFTAPHTPFQAPREYLDRYADIANLNRRTYAAMVSAMDEQIARVVRALEQRGMRDDTLIVFHSDNGGVRTAAFAGEIETKGELPADNGPYRDGKGSLYEGGTRAVALANWPGQISPGRVDQLMHVVDMFPTLTGLAGANAGRGKPLDGMNVWPAIRDGSASPREEVVYNVELFRGAVRRGDWKLVWHAPLPSKLELFDLSRDRSERTNLAAQHPEKARELQRRIDDLAGEMAKSLFFTATFQAIKGRKAGPPIFPNEDAYFVQGD